MYNINTLWFKIILQKWMYLQTKPCLVKLIFGNYFEPEEVPHFQGLNVVPKLPLVIVQDGKHNY
jgi:hypothetical protein